MVKNAEPMKLRQAKKILKASVKAGTLFHKILFCCVLRKRQTYIIANAFTRCRRHKNLKVFRLCIAVRSEVGNMREFIRIQEAKQKSTIIHQGTYTIQ